MKTLIVPVIAAPLASIATTLAAASPPLEDRLTAMAELVVQLIIGVIALIGLIRSMNNPRPPAP